VRRGVGWLAGALLGLGGVALVLLGIVFLSSEYRIRHKYSVEAAAVPERTDSAGFARGDHLYHSIGCASCHGADGGGALYLDAGPIGLAAGPNLTSGRGGIASLWSNTDLVRAIRHGLRPDSTSLILMPSEVFVHLTDDDLGAIIGYLRRLPPVDREVPQTHLRILGRALLAVGKLPLLVAPKTPPFADPDPVEPGPTAAYGRYLAGISSCHACHGAGLTGGPMAAPGAPPASNLTPAGLSRWSEADFVTALRQGRRPDGSTLHQIMPWREYRNMTDEDLAALWRYLRSVPVKPSGGKG
jgi:mono/diheme cytochrome c family protein